MSPAISDCFPFTFASLYFIFKTEISDCDLTVGDLGFRVVFTCTQSVR